MKLFSLPGKGLFYLTLPLLQLYLARTHRVYVVMRTNDEVLLVKNWYSDQLWRLPGGGIHRRESVAAAASREIYEELRVRVPSTRLHKISEGVNHRHGLRFNYEIFEVNSKQKVAVKPRMTEIIATRWFNIMTLPRSMDPELRVYLTKLDELEQAAKITKSTTDIIAR